MLISIMTSNVYLLPMYIYNMYMYWKSLRTQFTREKSKGKKRKSGDGADDVYRSKWQHLSQINFIEAFVTPKSSRSNLKVRIQ